MFRKTIIVVALAAALPSPPDNGTGATPVGVADANMFAYVTAAADTVTDLRGFCVRNAGVCSTAGHLAVTMEAKAKYSARLIYEWANEATMPSGGLPPLPMDLALADTIETGSVAGAKRHAGSGSTLNPEDLVPKWQSPEPQPQG